MKKPFSVFQLVFIFLSGLILLFIIAPLAGMFLNCSGSDFSDVAADKQVRDSIFLTLSVSMTGTMMMAVGAIPLAYLLARHEFPLKGFVSGIIDIPIVIPHSAAGIALLCVLSKQGVFGRFAAGFGVDFVDHPAGIMMAMAFVSLPFLINAARNGFENVPIKLEKAAMTLGASPSRVFFNISLPMAWRSVMTGLIMMWARGLSEFGAVIIIAYHPMVTPVMIYQRFTDFGLKYARSVAAFYIIICLGVFIAFRLLSGRKKYDYA